ncbi:hypothetical protein IEN85_17450 [Pelagicoccus sp. NFK12]|uniref:Uncharacterized protein n=1 Tax=Pelagicoccus enzymogenes TaxID=2773457 RepID=A0A927IJ90_9BACT|nr:hypothetical protein [Pelagicoccus enzymogenes]MBD5781290.1 hypothetical protein [Pelagicoccus enzymogenes]
MSLSNSVLLLGQFAAWSSMTKERLDDRGVGAALLSSIEGQDLCEVCLVVREENRKQSESGTLKESAGIAKLLVMADDCELALNIRPSDSFCCIQQMGTNLLAGRSDEVSKPPPRVEV